MPSCPKGTPLSNPTSPPAGWYPDQEPGKERYWDGAAWTLQLRPLATTPPSTGAPVTAATFAPTKKKRKWPWIVGAAVAAVILIPAIATAGNRGSDDVVAENKPAAVEEVDEPAAVEEVDTRVEIPDLTGLTVGAARAELTAAGYTLAAVGDVGDDWVISTQAPSGGEKREAGTAISVTATAPAPVYTLAQQNVIKKAQSYLKFSGFSRQGLIEQLEYEGFTPDDSTFGADNAGADWNAEAAEKAASYLKFSAFSRDGLYEQMAYEKFSDSEIQFALTSVGY